MKDINKNKIVITGASSSIGCAIFQELFQVHQEDDFILHCYRNPEVLTNIKQEKGGTNILVYPVDFRDKESLEVFVESLRETDILINAAAITRTGPLPHLSEAEVNHMIRVNIEAFTRVCGAVIPGMVVKRRGCIINISSVAASRGNRGQSVYAGTKGYVEAFTRSLAAEYGAKNIRANCVAPGPIQSGSLEELLAYASEEVENSIVANRLGSPLDVARVVAFLCSDKADFINGKTIGVDGGFMRGI